MKRKVKWGVLGAARIAIEKVIPGMQQGEWGEVTAIASRDLVKAEAAAKQLGIPRAYGSYEELLADPEIEAIYNPLPNHLHVPWSMAAIEAGKHVMCEKPVSMTVAECRQLMAARDRHSVKAGEAFMVRSHPQWLRTRELVRSGALGELRSVIMGFSYNNRDPGNIRNVLEFGGGGLMDIGCYPIQLSRFLFGSEPRRVSALMERDPGMGVDRLTSGMLEFEGGQAVFTCGTQMTPFQRTHVLGTKGRVEVEIPVNAPPDGPTRIMVNDAVEECAVCDQYTLQGDAFSRAIREGGEVPTPLEDSLRNMAVIEALFRSARTGQWESPGV